MTFYKKTDKFGFRKSKVCRSLCGALLGTVAVVSLATASTEIHADEATTSPTTVTKVPQPVQADTTALNTSKTHSTQAITTPVEAKENKVVKSETVQSESQVMPRDKVVERPETVKPSVNSDVSQPITNTPPTINEKTVETPNLAQGTKKVAPKVTVTPEVVNQPKQLPKYEQENSEKGNKSTEATKAVTVTKPQGAVAEKATPAVPKPQKVRVIVEFNKESILDYATEQKKTVAQLNQADVEKKLQSIKQEQDKVLKNIEKSVHFDSSKVKRYDAIINGVALDIQAQEIEKLKTIADVRRVYVSQEYVQTKPLLSSSGQLIGLPEVWNKSQYKGEGTVVAVIDSGVDFKHQALKIKEPNRAKYNKTSIEKLIHEKNLKGKFYSEKVPYGYNYYDYNDNLKDSYGVMHGMHVTGIVGANDDNQKLYGVAPNAQILAMKVFSDDQQNPTTFTDVWLKALDDAILLKADVVNMSLGTPAGFVHEGKDYPELEVIARARKAGIVIAVAAGNEGNITDGNTYGVKPLAENYDTALIANPALDDNTLAVASMENLKKHAHVLTYQSGKTKVTEVINLHVAPNASKTIIGLAVDLGAGAPSELSKHFDLSGKIAMFEIPEDNKSNGFLEKVQAITKLKPEAILLYNNAKVKDDLGSQLLVESEAAKFNIARITRSTYNNIKNKSNKIITILTERQAIDNSLAGQLSSYSSWGPTPDLRLKPEITAPGGHIFSTVEDNQYADKSGTSMAAPQVAGAAAVLKQYITDKKIPVDNAADFIKLLLMNTAQPIINKQSKDGKTPYFVRQQGSGAMNLAKALVTTVVATVTGTNDNNADGKLELRELKEKKFKARILLRNFGKTNKTYIISSEAIADPVDEKGFRTQNSEHLVSKKADTVTRKVTVEAGKTLAVDLDVDYSDAEALTRNNFLEGYLNLKDTEGVADLHLPFLGFYGSWTEQKAIDAFEGISEIGNGDKKRRVQFYVNKETNKTSSTFTTNGMLSLPIYNNTVFFSPNSPFYDKAGVRIAALRNMEYVQYSIIDPDTNKEVRVLGRSHDVRKLYRLDYRNSFAMMPDSIWDGKIKDQIAKGDKQYIYQIKVQLNNKGVGGDGVQIYQYYIKMDNNKPYLSPKDKTTVEKLEDRWKKITFKVQDTGIGLKDVYLQSVKYVGGGNNNLDLITPPGFKKEDKKVEKPKLDRPPGIDLPAPTSMRSFDYSTPPGTKPSKPKDSLSTPPGFPDLNTPPDEAPKDSKKDAIEDKSGAIKYAKSLQLSFVDDPILASKVNGKILQVESDGKLVIPRNALSANQFDDTSLKIYRNNNRNKEITITTDYFADTKYVNITAVDYLSNTTFEQLATGETVDYHAIVFSSFAAIKDKGGKIYVNDKLQETSRIALKDKSVKIGIELPNDVRHIDSLSVRRLNEVKTVDNILKNDEQDINLSKTYQLKYNPTNRRLEFTINNINSSSEIMTTFKDGKMPELVEQKDVSLDINDMDMSKFKTIRLGRKDSEFKGQLIAKTGTVELDMFFKQSQDPASIIKKIYLI